MSRRVQIVLWAVGFDLYWTLVVLFRERGVILWLMLALLACWLLPPGQRVMALGLMVLGCLLDSLWVISGFIVFDGGSLLPLWMISLWLMFACVWTRLICTTTLPLWLMTLLATVGGPAAYVVGEHLDAIVFLRSEIKVVSWMACGWWVMAFLFHSSVRRWR